jgi:hypothetical protein
MGEKEKTQKEKKMKEQEYTLIKEWKHKGKNCVVIKITWCDEVKAMSSLNDYCCGYVETSSNESYDEFYEDANPLANFNFVEELTYGADNLEHLRSIGVKEYMKKYFGFDTTHLWNMENPESQKPEYSIKKCEELAEQFLEIKK